MPLIFRDALGVKFNHANQNLLTISSNSVEQTQAIGAKVGAAAVAGDVIGLVGELGAGKTQFVRGLAMGLEINPDQVASPTFVLCREYLAEDATAASLALVHIDAYRLGGPNDLQTIGWGETGEELRDQAVVAVEWADRVDPALGENRLMARLEHTANGRGITLQPLGNWIDRLDGLNLPNDG